jgi:hypothetical protein
MTDRSEQGTGKHPHKDAGEPWPHNERSASEHGSHSGSERQSASSERGRSSGSNQAGSGDLKQREYRDDQGNVHHHTHTSEAMKGKGRNAA